MEEWAPDADPWLTALADGEPVDWSAAEASARSPQQRQFVRQLQLVARIAETYRDVTTPASAASRAGVDTPIDVAEPAPGTRWGGLEIVSALGRGTFGDVYRARDTRLDRIIALKLLRTERHPKSSLSSEVVNEGRLLARVRHPNVATVFGADRIDGRVGVWMELIEGRTLEEELRERGALPPDEVARIGLDLCRALAAVHAAGLLHRDIKTQNVMRDGRDGRIVLMDLSAGRELTELRAVEASMPLSLAGSPAYLAPEVLRGQPANVQSDIYSLGVLLFRLLTRAFPVAGTSLQDISDAHTAGVRTRLCDLAPDLPPALLRMVEAAIHPSASKRPQCARAMEQALLSVVEPTLEPTLRRRNRAVACAAAALIAAAGLAVASRSERRSDYSKSWVAGPSDPRALPVRVFFPPPDADDSRADSARTVYLALQRALERESGVIAMPAERASAIRELMRVEDGQHLDSRKALELARRDGQTDAVVTAAFEDSGQVHLLTVSLWSVDTGSEKSVVVRAADQATLVAEARREVRSMLSTVAPRTVTTPPLPPVTTHSFDALTSFARAIAIALSDHPMQRLGLGAFGEPAVRPTAQASIPLLEEALRADERFTIARAWLALLLRESGAPVAMYRAHARRVIAEAPSVSKEERLFALGAAYLVLDQPAEAIRALEALLPAAGSFVELPTRMLLGLLYRTQSRAPHPNVQDTRLADLHPDDFDLNVDAAMMLVAADGDSRRAAPYAARARARLTPSLVQRDGTCFQAAWLQYLPVFDRWHRGDVAGAIADHRTLSAKIDAQVSFERDAMATMSGYMWLMFGRVGQARAAFHKVGHTGQREMNFASMADLLDDRAAMAAHLSKIEWSYSPAWFAKAGLFDRAQSMLRRPVLHQELHENIWARGEQAMAEGRLQRAIELIQQTVELQRPRRDVGFYSASWSLVAAWRAAGQPTQVLRVLQETVAESPVYGAPGPSTAWWLMAQMRLADEYKSRGRLDDARSIERTMGPMLSHADESFRELSVKHRAKGRRKP